MVLSSDVIPDINHAETAVNIASATADQDNFTTFAGFSSEIFSEFAGRFHILRNKPLHRP
jgi:hypothetical protein